MKTGEFVKKTFKIDLKCNHKSTALTFCCCLIGGRRGKRNRHRRSTGTWNDGTCSGNGKYRNQLLGFKWESWLHKLVLDKNIFINAFFKWPSLVKIYVEIAVVEITNVFVFVGSIVKFYQYLITYVSSFCLCPICKV